MTDSRERTVEALIRRIPTLTAGQLYWLERVVTVFDGPHDFQVHRSDFLREEAVESFGDALRIHHSSSAEAFSKDKFEYTLERVLQTAGQEATLAPKGHRGYDIMVDGTRVSLKTQADKGIRADRIWISKFMELGRGDWTDRPTQLGGLRRRFLDHMDDYDRIFTLRALQRAPDWHYELVEIPKSLLATARNGELEMKMDSAQVPKPGYCHVRTDEGEDLFQLYFNGGTERKLQVKNLSKRHCHVHATWRFRIPPG